MVITTSKSKELSLWHESHMEQLFVASGSEVQREPWIMGKTPDLLVSCPDNTEFIVECIARLQDPHNMEYYLHDKDTKELHRNIYSRLDCKATKYRDIAERIPYVIALYDTCCISSLGVAFDVLFSSYAPTTTWSPDGKVKGKLYNKLWTMPEIPAALFELYPHLSGFIYSPKSGEHYYVSNPYATLPINTRLFPFAEIANPPDEYRYFDYQPRSVLAIEY